MASCIQAAGTRFRVIKGVLYLGRRVHGARDKREKIWRSPAVEHERREEGHIGLQGKRTRGGGGKVRVGSTGPGREYKKSRLEAVHLRCPSFGLEADKVTVNLS